jgi:tetratricopeptide (TPR) repeat protein
LTRAAELFQRFGEETEESSGYWRAARATWIAGDLLPLDATEARVDVFTRALLLADRGLVADPDCAECMLWKFTAMGRLRTTSGIWEGVRQLPEMAALLDRAIALQPTHRDDAHNSTLGNLHYSSAIFYRLVPEWFWIRWVLGVKGDKERALEHSLEALALHPQRLDYQIEVGTQLLCLGSLRDDPLRTRTGMKVMHDAIAREAAGTDQAREIHFARIMLAEPDRACGYSGDKLLDMDEAEARKAAR